MKTKIQNYHDLLLMNYDSAILYLNNKYGPVKDDYFREKSYERFFLGKIKYITRGKYSRAKEDGLYCHHVAEDKYYNLGDPLFCKTYNVPFEVQKRDNLVYCNLVEHFILHLLIMKKTNGEFGANGALGFLLPFIIDWYIAEKEIPSTAWIKSCYKAAYLRKKDALELLNFAKDNLPTSISKELEWAYFNHMNFLTLEKKQKNEKISLFIRSLQAVFEAKDRKLHPKRWDNLDKIVRFAKEREAKKATEDELKLEKAAFKEFHKKYPNLQNIDVGMKVSRDKIISLLYQEKYNRAYQTKKDYKNAALNTLREDLLIELNTILSNRFEDEGKPS